MTTPSFPTPSTAADSSRFVKRGILESHDAALVYLAWCDHAQGKKTSVRQLIGRAVVALLKERGVYLTARGMLACCPICEQDLTDRTVARYLLARKVWICGSCHRQINRVIEQRRAEQLRRPTPLIPRDTRPRPRREA